MKYEEYIQSEKWKELRKLILSRDNNSCQTCGCTENLEIHHKHYDNLFHEPLDDLITLCRECHKAITSVHRSRTYRKTNIDVEIVMKSTPIQNEVGKNDIRKIEMQMYKRSTPDNAQWSNVSAR